MATRVSVISSEYCLPNSVKLKLDIEKGVAYINNEVNFRVEAPSVSLRVLCDVSGSPVFTLYKKHHGWQVFKGDSTDPTQLLFSVVNASDSKMSCDICAHGSSTILAKMTNNGALEVDVHPDVDYAFIVAVLMIVDETNEFKFAKIMKDALEAARVLVSATEMEVEISKIINDN